MEFRRDKELNGMQWVYQFDNGYSLSVVCNDYSYGGRSGLFEVALLHNGEFCDFPWGDVQGWCNFANVAKLIAEVEQYQPATECTHTSTFPAGV